MILVVFFAVAIAVGVACLAGWRPAGCEIE